ncbi:MAG: 30S ribosomal protein S3 [Candidatus Yanofskybacteria bacterium CG10_big_fil_rev_8_21_14_0_10_46_23]|uniref:Small ribosomal subunit protein uS3 n=1 Tax=Candidatus Yanofskybacteria bacterium CG10_big_fil_rev_8_21_14_0_10_46_23 TaxID=1975098 RepID=A0A2H0R3W6_9BACT|nr:MAG: 30S ribosomal protein S3 [Candidatus Yanofskybacteria bacterium CG10_big_fil_rev_8_21_14_0_10_46_23]
MGQKSSPTGFRVGFQKKWLSRWFNQKNYKEALAEDLKIRIFLEEKLKNMSVDRIEIERSPDVLSIVVKTARPGLVIGRGGTGVEELKKKIGLFVKMTKDVRLDIQEYRNPESSARIMAESIAEQLERRMPFRRAMKQTLAKMMANRDVQGAKIRVSGRLNGAEIARAEHIEGGKLPLQTLRANIDYAQVTAHTAYGTIGVKVWIYKGEMLDIDPEDNFSNN